MPRRLPFNVQADHAGEKETRLNRRFFMSSDNIFIGLHTLCQDMILF